MPKDPPPPPLTPALLLQGYASGVFPMSDGRDTDEVYWVEPRLRGLFPLDQFHMSRSLRRRIRAEPYTTSVNRAFTATVAACADREDTWINAPIEHAYLKLHRMGQAHSIEVWDNTTLVGGVYGVTLGAAFFGESMFSRRKDASKIALAMLISRLTTGGFQIFDTQFLTPHLASLGAIEIPQADYLKRLMPALAQGADFHAERADIQPLEVLHRRTQTS